MDIAWKSPTLLPKTCKRLKSNSINRPSNHSSACSYDIMLHCWSANPESRPLFSDLEKCLGRLLENGVAEHYIDLNEPYLQMNVDLFTNGQTDYLSLMSAPDCPPPPVPVPNQYVNCNVPAQNSPSYVSMSPTMGGPQLPPEEQFSFPALNSPTTANNLNTPPTAKPRIKKPEIPEEIPMLKRSGESANSDSDPEISPDAQSGGRNFTEMKPSPRRVNNENDYVNVPSTIINMNNSYNKDTVTNPSYVSVKNVNETKT